MPGPWFFFALIAAWMVLACLRVLAIEYSTAVAWHDLRVRVQALRRQHQRRLEDSADTEPTLRRITGGPTADIPSLTEAVDPAEEAVEVLEAIAA